ncbi:MAG TPA: M20/M25/M40 family metallo-hydrolase [bacterium]|nr:M20/M25/M40 family metallo-hydrolase [bacterium]
MRTLNEERLVSTFVELALIDAVSGHERRLADFLRARFEELGLETEEEELGADRDGDCGNILVRIPGPVTPPVLFSAHLDTVQSTAGIEIYEEAGVFRSRGERILGADDRAGIAVMLEAARVLSESGGSPAALEYLFTVSEETGLRGVSALSPAWLQARDGFVLDLGGEITTLVNRAPYGQKLRFLIKGKPAHAGIEPEQGISAVSIAARAIDRTPLGRIDPETTANIGIIKGGSATNIVPGEVEVWGEARSLDPKRLADQVGAMVDSFRAAAREYGGTVEIESTREYPGFHIHRDTRVFKLAEAASEALGLPFHVDTSCGASDANILNGKGITVLNLSVGMGSPHSHSEYLRRIDLINAGRLILQIIDSMDPSFRPES